MMLKGFVDHFNVESMQQGRLYLLHIVGVCRLLVAANRSYEQISRSHMCALNTVALLLYIICFLVSVLCLIRRDASIPASHVPTPSSAAFDQNLS